MDCNEMLGLYHRNYHWRCCFIFASAHGSAPIEEEPCAFCGADAIDGFRVIGAGFTGTMEAELEDVGCDGTLGGAGGTG